MSRLLVVRHGQASAGSADYDQLSERGYCQARALGEQWAAEGVVPESVYLGPRRRHRQTAETLAAAGGFDWPEPIHLDDWDEHQGYAVVQYAIQRHAPEDDWVAGRRAKMESGEDGHLRAYFDLYQHFTRKWVRQELDLDGAGFEPWDSFRTRVERGIERLLEAEGRGTTVAVFTSSGPVAVAVGRALGLGDERMIELSWVVRNIAVSEILFTGSRFSLKSFNGLPQLADRELTTLI